MKKALIPASFFEDTWGLKEVRFGKVIIRKDGRAAGMINCSTGKYFFKTAGSWKTSSGVKKDTTVFDALHKKKFDHAPRLLKTQDGKNFATYKNKFVYIISYISGNSPKRTAATYKKLALVTARLHGIKKFPFKTDFDPAIIIKDLCRRSKKWKFGAEYRRIAKSLPDFSRISQSVIHTDIAPTNSIETKSGKIVFIDWDDAGIGPTVIDLGAVLNELIRENTAFKKSDVQAFYQTYFSKRKMSRIEKAHIVDACIFFALMYIVHGNLRKRWKRILWLEKNRIMLITLIFGIQHARA